MANIKKEDLKEIQNDFNSVVEQMQEEFGEGSITIFENDSYKQEKDALSSGSVLLDNILWNAKAGGYVKGRIVEISGLHSSGKSTMAFHAVRECQKIGGTVVYFDLENGMDPEYIKGLGINAKKLIISYPRSGEEAFDMLIKFVEMNVGLIVVDSVSNLVPSVQLNTSLEKTRIGAHAALMSIGLRRVKNSLTGKKTVIIFINQLRNNINTGFFHSNPEVATGGLALQYEADVRIKLRFRERIEKNDKIIGIKVEAKITKNRFSRPFGVVELEIIYPSGIRKNKEILKLAVEKGVVKKSGNWYSYEEKRLGNGPELTADFLDNKENDSILKQIKDKVFEILE